MTPKLMLHKLIGKGIEGCITPDRIRTNFFQSLSSKEVN